MNSSAQTVRNKDIFVRSSSAGHFLYAPLAGLVLAITSEVATFIADLRSGRPTKGLAEQDKWISFLNDADELSRAALSDVPCKHDDDVASPFLPTHVTLSLTTGCNLRCVYCYIRGGEHDRAMPKSLAQASIDFVAENAVTTGRSSFGVTFHGEGEPTYNWSLFRDVVLYAEDVARSRKIDVTFAMTTNALWGAAQREFISRRFSDLSISLDGLPEVQGQQRPTVSGKDSFQAVKKNLVALGAAGIPVGVRATVLPKSVDKMIPFLEFLASETKVRAVRFEPIFNAGRATELREEEIGHESFDALFASNFLRAKAFGKTRGLSVDYSGCGDINKSGNFCGATGGEINFTVMSSGLVSSCYEINDTSHELGEFFVYGEFDRSSGQFEFWNEKLNRLRNYSTKSNSPCASCFAQWNCRGDCLARYEKKALLEGGSSPRCSLNRTLTDAAIVEAGSNSAQL